MASGVRFGGRGTELLEAVAEGVEAVLHLDHRLLHEPRAAAVLEHLAELLEHGRERWAAGEPVEAALDIPEALAVCGELRNVASAMGSSSGSRSTLRYWSKSFRMATRSRALIRPTPRGRTRRVGSRGRA